jgi:two-component system phosphate regulon response regulator PhoB
MTVPLQILIADDDPVLRELLQLKLKAEGHTVSQASTGDEALRMVSDDPPQLLVLDIAMPGTNGLEVTRWLRKRPQTADLPIVLLTGRDTDHDIVTGWRSGASYYITKPFVIEHLRYFIRTLQGNVASTRRWEIDVD